MFKVQKNIHEQTYQHIDARSKSRFVETKHCESWKKFFSLVNISDIQSLDVYITPAVTHGWIVVVASCIQLSLFVLKSSKIGLLLYFRFD